MPRIRNEPGYIDSRRYTVALLSGECYQGTGLSPNPPPGFIRLLGLDRVGGGSPWCAVAVPIQNVKCILTEVEGVMGHKVSLEKTPLSPDIVVEQRAEPCTHQLHEKQFGANEWRCTACSAVVPVPPPEPRGTAMEDPNPRPEPEEDAERWSRHE